VQEWEAVFLETPRLYESVNVLFRGQKCQTSHIANIQTVEGTDPVQYRVKTMSGGVYIGPVSGDVGLSAHIMDAGFNADEMDPGTYS
jgi:hypothetical protein